MLLLFMIIFWLSFSLCLSTYFLYPLVIGIVGIITPFRVKKKHRSPFISVIIPAFNESKHIAQKIQNTLETNYPGDKMEILVGSDGSTDETASIMQALENEQVVFFDFKENRGKTAVQNDLVNQAKGEVLIFTDAASFVSPDAFQALVDNFNDSHVGCAAGCMLFLDTDTNLTTKSQGLYWRYESKIRELESRIGALVGVDGPLYAVTPDCYVPLGANMISDLLTPLLVIEKGKKVVFEPKAEVYEEPTAKTIQEFKTRRRITLRGLVGLSTHNYLINPLIHPVLSFQIFFHKALRWSVGFLWLANMISCALLSKHLMFLILLSGHFLFLFLALLGWFTSHKGTTCRILTVPYYFCLVNLAATMGIIDFVRKKQMVSWKPVR